MVCSPKSSQTLFPLMPNVGPRQGGYCDGIQPIPLGKVVSSQGERPIFLLPHKVVSSEMSSGPRGSISLWPMMDQQSMVGYMTQTGQVYLNALRCWVDGLNWPGLKLDLPIAPEQKASSGKDVLDGINVAVQSRAQHTNLSNTVQSFLQAHQLNLTGQGIRIVLLEPGTPERHGHTTLVSSIIKHPNTGIAPDASVEMGLLIPAPKFQFQPSSLSFDTQLQERIETLLIHDLEQINDQLRALLRDKGKRPHIINISASQSFDWVYRQLFKEMNAIPPDKLQMLGPEASWVLQIQDQSVSISERFKKLTQFIRPRMMEPSLQSRVSQGMTQYRQSIQQLADQGVVTVVALGNRGDDLPLASSLYPWEKVNWFGNSSEVVLIGGSDNYGTPLDTRDDVPFKYNTPVPWSPYGFGINMPLTLLPANLYFTQLFDGSQDIAEGTSVSAPLASGLLALWMEYREKTHRPLPSLVEIQSQLKKASVNPNGYSPAQVGHGFLDVQRFLSNTLTSIGT